MSEAYKEKSLLHRIYYIVINIVFGVVLAVAGIMILMRGPAIIFRFEHKWVIVPYLLSLITGAVAGVWYTKRFAKKQLFDLLTAIASGLVIGFWIIGIIVIAFRSIFSSEIILYFEDFFIQVEKSILFVFIYIGLIPLIIGLALKLKEALSWSYNTLVVVIFMMLFGLLIVALIPSVSDKIDNSELDTNIIIEKIVNYIIGNRWLNFIVNIIIGGSLFTFAYQRFIKLEEDRQSSMRLDEYKKLHQ